MKLEHLKEARLMAPSEAEWSAGRRRPRQLRLKIQPPRGVGQRNVESIIKTIINQARIASEQLGVSVPKKIRYGGGRDEWVYITANTNALRDILEKIAKKTQYVSVHSEYEYLKDKDWLNSTSVDAQ